MSQEPQEDASPTPARGPALLTRPSVCGVTARALPEFSASKDLKGHDLQGLQGAGSDIGHPTTNSKARLGVARRCGQGTPARTGFPLVQCGRIAVGPNVAGEPKHFREAGNPSLMGNPYFPILEMNSNFSELCAGAAQCDCRTNPTYRHRTVHVKLALGPAQCPAQCPVPWRCSAVAEQSRS